MGYENDTLHESPIILSILNILTASFTFTVILDPVIYFYVERNLRIAFRRMLGIKGTFSWEETFQLK